MSVFLAEDKQHFMDVIRACPDLTGVLVCTPRGKLAKGPEGELAMAAPELLEACKALVSDCGNWRGLDDRTIRQARRAIEKATGGDK